MTQVLVDSSEPDPLPLLARAATGLVVIQPNVALKVNNDFDDLNDNGDGITLAANTVYQWPVVGTQIYATAASDAIVEVLVLSGP